MAKWYGMIGYAESVEATPGNWEEQRSEERRVRNTRRLEGADKVNDDINIANEISIIADPFACQNFHRMRYIEFMGAKWKISNVEVKYPRLILTTGGVYNAGQTA